MINEIEITIKESYGRKLIYVNKPEIKQAIKQITGKETLTGQIIKGFISLGIMFIPTNDYNIKQLETIIKGGL